MLGLDDVARWLAQTLAKRRDAVTAAKRQARSPLAPQAEPGQAQTGRPRQTGPDRQAQTDRPRQTGPDRQAQTGLGGSIAVVIRFEGTVLGHADVGGLLGSQLGQ